MVDLSQMGPAADRGVMLGQDFENLRNYRIVADKLTPS